jgi:hypothetical protein
VLANRSRPLWPDTQTSAMGHTDPGPKPRSAPTASDTPQWSCVWFDEAEVARLSLSTVGSSDMVHVQPDRIGDLVQPAEIFREVFLIGFIQAAH